MGEGIDDRSGVGRLASWWRIQDAVIELASGGGVAAREG
jgi:hypothetical protein